MKKSLLVITIVMLLSQFAIANTYMKQYYYKTGLIKYKLTGNINGDAIYYWDDYGAKKSDVSIGTAKMMGISRDYKRVRIAKNEEQYESKNNKTPKVEDHKQFVFWLDHQDITDPHKFNIAFMKEIEMKNTNIKETICGYKCGIWEKKGMKMWIYQGMMMKMEISKMGFNFEMTATEFKKNVKVPKGTFDISN